MNAEVLAWCQRFRERYAHHPLGTAGACQEAVEELLSTFPSEGLLHVRGNVHLLGNRPNLFRHELAYPHHWVQDAEGNIYDPTRDQFPGEISYDPLPDQGRLPTGKCPNCGGLCYDHHFVCSDECQTSYMDYIRGGCR